MAAAYLLVCPVHPNFAQARFKAHTHSAIDHLVHDLVLADDASTTEVGDAGLKPIPVAGPSPEDFGLLRWRFAACALLL